MRLFLSLIIGSFIITSLLLVPFINFLYQRKFLRRHQKTDDFQGKRTPIFDKFNRQKAGTPIGAGILLVLIIIFLFAITFFFLKCFHQYVSSCFPLYGEVGIIFFTLISFGLLGFLDDYKKIFDAKKRGVFGLRLRHKFILQWLLAFIIAAFLYFNLGISIINIPFLGVFDIGFFYFPLAAFVIVAFTNAFNITDGQDGLAGGLLVFCLLAFSTISFQIFDTPLTIFSAIWIGSLIAFLYFNIYPARVFLGDTGALAFGATMAVIGLLLGKIIALTIIGGIFVLEATSSLIQILGKLFFRKTLLPVSPVHLWLREKGWEEPKIVARAWLVGIMLAVLGLWLATF